jgi:hypothetical protein
MRSTPFRCPDALANRRVTDFLVASSIISNHLFL